MAVVSVAGEALTVDGDPITIGGDVSIPGVETFHPRTAWVEPCFPVSGRAQIPKDIWQPVAHYSAATNTPDGDIGEFDYQIIPWLRAVNRDYWINRKNASPTVICNRSLPGYSIGYLFAVDWLGGVWELRGFDFMPAANASHNHYTAPVLFITDGASAPTDLAWASARAVWREFERRAARSDFKVRPLGHGELYTTTGLGTPTACPGAGVLDGLHSGKGDLDYDDTPPATEAPPMATLNPSVRVLDTRINGGKLGARESRRVGVLPPPGPWARAVIVDIGVADTDDYGWIAAWDGVKPMPGTSSQDYPPRSTYSNTWHVPISGDDVNGWGFTVFTIAGCHLTVDLQGYDSVVG